MRWRDGSVSFYGRGLRAKLHATDPWRWESRQCVCRKEWESLSAEDASRVVALASVRWGDPDFAARQFRRSVGVAPGRYRAMNR